MREEKELKGGDMKKTENKEDGIMYAPEAAQMFYSKASSVDSHSH